MELKDKVWNGLKTTLLYEPKRSNNYNQDVSSTLAIGYGVP